VEYPFKGRRVDIALCVLGEGSGCCCDPGEDSHQTGHAVRVTEEQSAPSGDEE